MRITSKTEKKIPMTFCQASESKKLQEYIKGGSQKADSFENEKKNNVDS